MSRPLPRLFPLVILAALPPAASAPAPAVVTTTHVYKQVRALEIKLDVEDAFTWLREHAREKLKADPSRIAVLGPLGGGYLTLSCGFRVKPRPTVLVSLLFKCLKRR